MTLVTDEAGEEGMGADGIDAEGMGADGMDAIVGRENSSCGPRWTGVMRFWPAEQSRRDRLESVS